MITERPPLAEEIDCFAGASNWAVSLIRRLPDDCWDGPGLGTWDMRALVGHTSRALLTIETYLGRPSMQEDLGSAEEYFEALGSIPGADLSVVLQRGIDAGLALGEDPATAFAETAERIDGILGETEDLFIESLAGGIRLSNYLPTRTFELIVHGLDIARAADLAMDPPDIPLRRSLDLAVSLATRSGDGPRLLFALTGRGELEPGYSVL